MAVSRSGVSSCGFWFVVAIVALVGIWFIIKKPAQVVNEQFENHEPYTFVMYYSPSCGHCKRAKPEFMKLGKRQTISGKPVKILFVNPKTEPEKVFGGPKILGYPTIRLYGPGSKLIEEFEEDRTYQSFLVFLNKHVR